jgi:DNA topoisomerase-1
MVPYFREVVDAGFTAKMEEELDEVEAGRRDWRQVVGECYYGYLKDELAAAMKDLEKTKTEPVLTGETCPECGRPLALRNSRYGEFIACTGYPECKYTQSIVKPVGVSCPKCGRDIIVKRSRRGKMFYGCSGYPECDQVFWYRPVEEKCPRCGSLLMVRGRKLVCSGENCGFSRNNE